MSSLVYTDETINLPLSFDAQLERRRKYMSESIVQPAQSAVGDVFGLDPKAIELGQLVIHAALDIASGKAVEVFLPATIFGKRLGVTIQLMDGKS